MCIPIAYALKKVSTKIYISTANKANGIKL